MFFTRKTRDLIVRGVPEALRGELWMLFSGISSNQNSHQKTHFGHSFAPLAQRPRCTPIGRVCHFPQRAPSTCGISAHSPFPIWLVFYLCRCCQRHGHSPRVLLRAGRTVSWHEHFSYRWNWEGLASLFARAPGLSERHRNFRSAKSPYRLCIQEPEDRLLPGTWETTLTYKQEFATFKYIKVVKS